MTEDASLAYERPRFDSRVPKRRVADCSEHFFSAKGLVHAPCAEPSNQSPYFLAISSIVQTRSQVTHTEDTSCLVSSPLYELSHHEASGASNVRASLEVERYQRPQSEKERQTRKPEVLGAGREPKVIGSSVILCIFYNFKENPHHLQLSSDSPGGGHRPLGLRAQSHEMASAAGPWAGSQRSNQRRK